MAFAAYLDAVQKIYIAFYQRPADPAGLRYWAQRMDAAGGDQAAVIDAFATSPEAVALYGPIDASTIGTVVDAIYLALYNRAPDADGKKFYVDGFNAGTFTPGTIALNILNGASNDDAVAIANKLVVANQFTQQVDGRALTNPDFGIGSSFNVTYAGDADAVAARDILKDVTSSPSTVLNAGEVTEVLKQKIADPTDPIQGESGGKTFTLTAGVDTVAGTSGNDTINAQAVDATGAAKTTLSGFDAIDGGVGTDTLNIYTTGTENATFPATATVKNVEVVNVYNTAAAAALGDASKFEGVTQLWQHGTNAADVSKLAATTTAGFKAVEATVAADLDVSAADTATTVTIALDGVKGDAATGAGTTENRADIDVDGAALNAVTVSGTLAAKTTAAAAKEVFTATFSAATVAGHLRFDGVDVTTIPIGTDVAVAAAFVAGYNAAPAANWVAVDNLDGTVTFTAKVAGGKTDVLPAGFDPHASGTDAAVTAVLVTTQGVDGAAPSLALNVTSGKDVESLSVNTAVTTTLTVTENAGSAAAKDIKTLDASASAGAITFGGSVTGGTAGSLATIKTGTGADTVTIATATLKDDAATTTVNEAVSALVETGAGNDKITVNTSGTGTTNVEAGDGNDTVTLTADGSGILTVNLGAGNDTFKGAGAVSATDVINAGDGVDTLLLSMVGAANIGAFSNFETFDAAALGKTLDVEILAAKNTVTEFVATADVGSSAVLTNIGAGVGYRVTGDTNVANALTLTQKTAGALTVTLDIDEAATTAASFDSGAKTNVDAAVIASNATSLKAVFDSSFKDAVIVGDASDNLTNLTLTGTKATSLEVVSGGAFAINDLVYTSGVSSTAGKDLLATVTISGDRALSVTINESAASTSQVTSINASALTGALTISTAELKASTGTAFDGGVLTLGSGADVITITTGAVISGLAKGTAEGATAQGAFDVLKTGGAVAQAADDVSTTDPVSVKDGLLTFNGTGPATLDAALALVATQLGNLNVGAAVVFEYVGNSYVYVDNATDVVVKLAGVTGLTGLGEVGTTDNLYVF